MTRRQRSMGRVLATVATLAVPTPLLAAPAPVPALAPATTIAAAEATRLAPPHWGLSLVLPDGWRWVEPQDYAALILPPETLPNGDAVTLALRNLRRPDDGAEGGGAAALADRLVAEMRAASVDSGQHKASPFRWDVGPGVVMGRQVVADISVDGRLLRQWTVFLPSPLAPVVHMWQFTAPPGVFEATLPDARRVLDSLLPRRPEDADGATH